MTSAPSRRRAAARWSSRRTKALTLYPLASNISVTLRPMEPTAPAAPVTRIGLACDDRAVISLPLDEFGRETIAYPRGVDTQYSQRAHRRIGRWKTVQRKARRR